MHGVIFVMKSCPLHDHTGLHNIMTTLSETSSSLCNCDDELMSSPCMTSQILLCETSKSVVIPMQQIHNKHSTAYTIRYAITMSFPCLMILDAIKCKLQHRWDYVAVPKNHVPSQDLTPTVCTNLTRYYNSQGKGVWRSRRHINSVAGPTLANSTVTAPPKPTVTPSLMRWVVQ